jgi:hypothetical protein
VAYCAVVLLALFNGVLGGGEPGAKSTIASLGKIAVETCVSLFMIWTIWKIFSDISKGLSPFSTIQAKRLRIAAMLWILHAIFIAFFSPAFMTITGLGDVIFGATIGVSPVEASTRYIPINVGDIVLAIVLFCAALIVEYGSLLQKLSDDTL